MAETRRLRRWVRPVQSRFSCGSDSLDQYLRVQVGQDARKHVTAPFVLCEGECNTVLGHYVLPGIRIDIGAWPENIAQKLPKYPLIPATLLGRLANGRQVQPKSAGEYLLMDALHRGLRASRQVAALAVIVDAKDARGCVFTDTTSLRLFEDQPDTLFLPIE